LTYAIATAFEHPAFSLTFPLIILKHSESPSSLLFLHFIRTCNVGILLAKARVVHIQDLVEQCDQKQLEMENGFAAR
jgi:hypothetical protein